MRIVSRPVSSGRRLVCATCGQGFVSGRREYGVISQTGKDLGPMCATCFKAKPPQLRDRIRRQAYLLRLQPQQIAWVWDGEQTPHRREEFARLLDGLAKEKQIYLPWWARLVRWWQR